MSINILNSCKLLIFVGGSIKSNVIYTDHYINGQDFEIELHLKNESRYINFLEEINKRFGRRIKDHFLITFYDVRIFKYFPASK